MNHYICMTCGTQYEKMEQTPLTCRICTEERQYVDPLGQMWTTLQAMRDLEEYENEIKYEEKGLSSITTKPKFAIGQTAYIVQNNGFNLMWDCVSYIDEHTIHEVEKLGGLSGIAISHPHYYSTQVEWAEIFNVPIYIHEDDKEWVNRSSERIEFWAGESLSLADGLSLYRLGGHFKGGTVLHWLDGNDGKGILLTGDIIQVVADRQWVSFMYSYPNLIPLPASKVEKIAEKVQGITFDRIYNAFQSVVKENANLAVQKSAHRYIAALNGDLFET
ncbi:hypothetical protein [Bacillus solimangrovi]|uniref:Metallo-beta-lactamase domain-containing protein n=1 Tax=Bacillus solimangrovi TaxID=1305675 RepID=A0A1E5LIE2_9BACI|nr:hypothetical protein [Bacillus solimangrovi]OEH93853.1 hypothetical protein BFG57_11070 [Bacillus solimangrovi]